MHRSKKGKKCNCIYDISEIDFINVFCRDGNEYRLVGSLSNGIVVVLLTSDDDVR
jgi:hypothetical protein